MPNWNHIVREHLAVLRLPPEREIEIVEELALHLEAAYEDALAAGLSETEAEARTVQSYDWRLLECELSRAEQPLAARALQPSLELIERKGGMRMESFIQDLRFSVRTFVKQPGFTLIAVMILALGIGANTAIFSLVNTFLFRHLPVREPDRLVPVFPAIQRTGEPQSFSYPNYVDVRDRNDVLSGLLAYQMVAVSLSRNGANEIIWGYLATGNYFELLGVKAALGRAFTPEDDRQPGAHPVVVLSYACWQKRFGADQNIVGQTALLNNQRYTIIGVAPPRFMGTEIVYEPEIWAPMMMARQIDPGSRLLGDRGTAQILCVGRLKAGVSLAQAESALSNVLAQLGREYPKENEGLRIMLTPPGLIFPTLRTPVIGFAGVLMLTVALVLLIACANLAGMLLARDAGRRKEIAIRLSLGAGRARLVRQLLTENLLLALAGGGAGMLLAVWLIGLVRAFKPPVAFPLLLDLHPDWRVLSFTLILSILTGALFGLLPALQATKPELVPALNDESALGGYRRSRLRSGLVVAQVALSLVLLVAAGLVVRSLQHAQV